MTILDIIAYIIIAGGSIASIGILAYRKGKRDGSLESLLDVAKKIQATKKK